MGLARFTVDVATEGMRLDVFIASQLALLPAAGAMSRAGVQKLIDAGHVTVNGARVKSSVRVKLADLIEIHVPAVREIGLIGEDLPLVILYEDEDVIVINKAAGMVVHPAAGYNSGTLVNAILHHCPAIAGIGGERRPGIVHRLDKDTSGVMVVAKNDSAMHSLVDQFKGRTVRKEYLALVHGRLAEERGEIDRAIGRHRGDRKRMSSLRVLGKSREATTEWIVESRYAVPGLARIVALYSLIRLLPRTGRTHQIRVHLADLGHPLVGDRVYGRRQTVAPQNAIFGAGVDSFWRHALHAEKLSFNHLRSGERLEFCAPLADDIVNLIQSLQGYTVGSESVRTNSSRPAGLTRFGV